MELGLVLQIACHTISKLLISFSDPVIEEKDWFLVSIVPSVLYLIDISNYCGENKCKDKKHISTPPNTERGINWVIRNKACFGSSDAGDKSEDWVD